VAATRDLPIDRADQLAAFAAGLIGLVGGTARCLDAGAVVNNVTELERGFVISMAVSTGASLLSLAGRGSDLALVSFEMAELIDRVGHAITPDARHDLFRHPDA
jgi:predicted regulator of Ras-like GTPase activity (Roadblock/LC7/MglB family)